MLLYTYKLVVIKNNLWLRFFHDFDFVDQIKLYLYLENVEIKQVKDELVGLKEEVATMDGEINGLNGRLEAL